ncbi:DUF937 domain-containing protein [Aequorivita marina]|uniref:DUF937 domain-containing protein n=1 Tax=Aequorivita marina TaxID=3073654 RepID=UPI0028752927|nr:DUF937 domain-containing protein [Aequorivita sp. S2608]MDS1297613.1 DUF937 domain-containing protein [Aequorivita sp. S2608]
MASILDLLSSDMGKQLIKGASAQTGQSSDKTATVLSMALPTILGAMQRNAESPEGAKSLNNALEDNRHDGSILNQLGGLLGDGGADSSLMNDGAGILNHVLGGKQSKVENNISRASGVDSQSVGKIIQMAAPVIMGLLGNQKRKNNVDQGGIGSLLGSMLGKSNDHDQSLITTLLDSDGDGSVIDDVAGMFLGGNKNKGGIGDMLGGLFGK